MGTNERLDEILTMWDKDSEVPETKLAETAMMTASLHAKYLRCLLEFKRNRTQLQADHDLLRRYKFRYYRGELSRKELEDMGWEQWQNAKPLKNEMDELVRGDKDVRPLVKRLEDLDAAVEAMEEILKQLKQRDFGIGNAIKWKIFLAGG